MEFPKLFSFSFVLFHFYLSVFFDIFMSAEFSVTLVGVWHE